AHSPPVFQNPDPYPGRLPCDRAEKHDVGNLKRCLSFKNSPLLSLLIRLCVSLDDIQLLHNHFPGMQVDRQDLSGLASFPTRNHNDSVPFTNFALSECFHDVPRSSCSYKTSGAKEMIFMNFFQRSSRATGPKIRVPIGSPSLLIKTHAFRSNLMYEPSSRRTSFVVRTM